MDGLVNKVVQFHNPLKKLKLKAFASDSVIEMVNVKAMPLLIYYFKVRKMAKIRNQYNQAPHPTQDTNGKVKTSQLDITNESQEVSPFPAGSHNA